jgi:lipopolysaccharide/colanic/teichoic acid biosynthesis glycosyltransferase
MKKIMKFFTALGIVSFVLGFVISIIEKNKENVKEEYQLCGLYEKYLKRPLDFALALLALIFLFPVMIIIALMVRAKLGSPVIFSQKRPGKDEKIFRLYKFRTMTEEKREDGKLLSDEERITDFGRKLRSSSLDELPELFNILKGDMGLVGPRPQLVRDMVFMTEEQRKRHKVRQGLTGLAQVSGRNGISWGKKLNYDVEYIQHISFIEDVKIILRTMKIVFHKDGIAMEGMETAEDLGDYLLRTKRITLAEYNEKQKEAEYICEFG